MRPLSEKDEARFWEKVNLPDAAGHMTWRMSKRKGYGQFALDDKTPPAHRVAYELRVGPIPDGMVIDHIPTCRVRACVAPEHLRPLTIGENVMADLSEAHTKINADKDECVNGHPFDEINTYRYGPDGRWRKCRACRATAVAKHRSAARRRER
jgi:hypothetical protein